MDKALIIAMFSTLVGGNEIVTSLGGRSGMSVLGGDYYEFRETGLETCHRMCRYAKVCGGVEWRSGTRECRLFVIDTLNESTIVEETNSVYFDEVDTVIQDHPCSNTPCSRDHICVPVTKSKEHLCMLLNSDDKKSVTTTSDSTTNPSPSSGTTSNPSSSSAINPSSGTATSPSSSSATTPSTGSATSSSSSSATNPSSGSATSPSSSSATTPSSSSATSASSSSGTSPSSSSATTPSSSSATSPSSSSATSPSSSSGTSPSSSSATTPSSSSATSPSSSSATTPSSSSATSPSSSSATSPSSSSATSSSSGSATSSSSGSPSDSSCREESDCHSITGTSCINEQCTCAAGYQLNKGSCEDVAGCVDLLDEFIEFESGGEYIKSNNIETHTVSSDDECTRKCINAGFVCKSCERYGSYCFLQDSYYTEVPGDDQRSGLSGMRHFHRKCDLQD